ncbi:MAG: hypothetical protein ACRD2L_06855, partial [Terriglobia bacterium]
MTRNVLVFVCLLSAVFLPAVSTGAQAKKIPRLGYLNDSPLTTFAGARAEAFRQGLRELGYVEGKNI